MLVCGFAQTGKLSQALIQAQPGLPEWVAWVNVGEASSSVILVSYDCTVNRFVSFRCADAEVCCKSKVNGMYDSTVLYGDGTDIMSDLGQISSDYLRTGGDTHDTMLFWWAEDAGWSIVSSSYRLETSCNAPQH